MTRVFVSHSHQNDAFTKRLVHDLQLAGVKVWVDFEDIRHGDFITYINEGLNDSEWVIPIFTPESLRSGFVNSEINAAFTMLMSGKIQGIIPVVAAPCNVQDIPPLWNNLHRYDATRDYDSALTSLLKAIGAIPHEKVKLAKQAATNISPVHVVDPINPDTSLEDEFSREMIHFCDECVKDIRYNPTFVRRTIAERGALDAARWVINIPNQTSGITKLWEAHRLDLSIEALILKPKYIPLFTREERAVARNTLTDLGYSASWDQGQ